MITKLDIHEESYEHMPYISFPIFSLLILWGGPPPLGRNSYDMYSSRPKGRHQKKTVGELARIS